MRIEGYRRDLMEGDVDGFTVIGSTTNWEVHDSSRCDPIKMSLTRSRLGSQTGIGWEELIQLADSDCFLLDEQTREMYSDFQEHYPEIIRGEHPDWQLGAFKVFYGGIHLDFGNRKTRRTAFLWIIGASRLRLTFEAPRTRLGFTPTYKVSINYDREGQSVTKVEEDLGYIRREIRFELKDPRKKTDIFHRGNQYLEITEYAGI